MNKNNNMSEMTAHKSRHFFIITDLILPVLLFAFTVVLFRYSALDLKVQSMFYRPQTGWFLKENSFFQFLYHYGNLPALFLSIIGLVYIGLSFQAMKWVKWRKIGLFLVLAMIIGPGLIINTTLKNNWGRPRPRNTIEFGGKYTFEKVLSIDKSSPGYSFPCGHASMGFYLFVPWFLLRKRKRNWAFISLTVGIIYGLLIGLARMAQGGHYFSDVIIAGLIVYLVGAGLYYLLKLHKALWFYPRNEEINPSQRTIVTITLSILLVFLVLGVVLATPYSKDWNFSSQLNKSQPASLLVFSSPYAELTIQPADSLYLSCKTQGFGFPGSKLNSNFLETTVSDTLKISLNQKRTGFFTELDNKINATYPFQNNSNLDVRIEKGSASIFLPDTLDMLNLNIRIEKGSLRLMLPKTFKPKITMKGDFTLTDNTGFNSNDEIFIKEEFKVNIIVVEGEVNLF